MIAVAENANSPCRNSPDAGTAGKVCTLRATSLAQADAGGGEPKPAACGGPVSTMNTPSGRGGTPGPPAGAIATIVIGVWLGRL